MTLLIHYLHTNTHSEQTLSCVSISEGTVIKKLVKAIERVTEGKIQGGIEVTGRQGRRCRKLLDDLKERRRYSHLKEEVLDRTMWRARFGRSFGPVVRQTTK